MLSSLRYGITEYEDCPKVEYRDFAPAKQMDETPFLDRKVQVKISDFEVRKGSWLQGEFSVFNVVTCTPEKDYKVARKDADFYSLRKALKT